MSVYLPNESSWKRQRIISVDHSICSDDKAVSEMKIADEQIQPPATKMYSKEGEDHLRHEAAIRRINSQLLDPSASPPFICDLCSVAFLTKRELQLHVMCHGIHIAGNVTGEKVQAIVQCPGGASNAGTTKEAGLCVVFCHLSCGDLNYFVAEIQ